MSMIPTQSYVPARETLIRPRPVPRTASDLPVRRITSQRLLDGERELVIQHQGGEYHLRLTRNDKLILTK